MILSYAVAVGMAAVWGGSLFLTPWRDHVPAFLGLFALLFGLYVLEVVRKKPQGLFGWGFVIGTAVLFRSIAFFSPPSLSDDIHRYLWDGRVQAAGINPYQYAPADPALDVFRNPAQPPVNHPTVATLYPPLSQMAFRLAARVPTLSAQKALFAGLELCLLGLMVLFLSRRGQGPDRLLLYAWNPLLIVEFWSSGHMDSLGLLFLVAGVFAWEASLFRRAGGLWGLAFLGKFASLIFLPWMILRQRGRGILGYFLLVVLLGYAVYFLMPLSELSRFFQGAATYAQRWSFNASVYALLLKGTPWSTEMIKIVFAVVAGGVAGLLALTLEDRQVSVYAGIVIALSIALSPVVHPWYVLWILPFVTLYPCPSGIALTGLAALSYLVIPVYATTGMWKLPAWVPWVEYLPVYALLFWELQRTRRPHRVWSPTPLGPPRVCVVIPAVDEEDALPLVLKEIPQNLCSWVIVADNGSQDQTVQRARAAGANVVHEPSRGYGRAVQAALRAMPAEANVVVILDGDHSDFPEDLPVLLDPLVRGEADFVIGSRIRGGAPRGSLTWPQRVGNALACGVIRVYFGQPFTDLGPFRALRRDLLEDLSMEDPTFGWNVEMQVKALRRGARVREVPVRYRSRVGRSKISGTWSGVFRAGVRILWALVRYRVVPLVKPKNPIMVK